MLDSLSNSLREKTCEWWTDWSKMLKADSSGLHRMPLESIVGVLQDLQEGQHILKAATKGTRCIFNQLLQMPGKDFETPKSKTASRIRVCREKISLQKRFC